MTCQRCGAEAELGLCEFCGRLLCVACYDGDQDGYCRPPPLVQRDGAIRALRGGGVPEKEVMERFGLSRSTVYRAAKA